VASSNGKPSIVFCHGIWADGSCFSKVIAPLQAAGYEAIAAQYALNTVEDDIATVKKTLGRVGGPAVLVGHSYGGQVITGAGVDARVKALVYICALSPDKGETAQVQQDQFPKTPVFGNIDVADGRVWLKASGISDFCGDLSDADQKVVWATHYPPDVNLFNQPLIETPAWKSKPSWSIIGKQDRTVHPDLERFLAKRMGATALEIDSSHTPMLSHPQTVFEVIMEAASAAY
jgi:pimeloyl-ACP methyl ester carboxylesterase